MKRNRLTLVVPEEKTHGPKDDATDARPVLTALDSGAPGLRLVQADEGSFPHDAA